MVSSLLLQNGKALIGYDLRSVDILIEAGKIAQISKSISLRNTAIIDCSHLTILPGIIDPHVHFREPGLTHKEDFFSGSCAAAKGGITSFFDMPNTIPPTTTIKAFEEKKKLAAKSVVHYGFHFGAVSDNQKELKEALQRQDICSIKLYMGETTGGLLVRGDNILEEIFGIVAEAKKVLCVHAEGKDVQKAISLARKYETILYICHVSSKEEIDFIRQAKKPTKAGKKNQPNNPPLYAEVAPHHLFLTKEDEHRLQGFGLMKPGLKTKSDQQALWDAIQDGTIDTIGTDHAPHTREEKQSTNPPFGVPGVETVLPLMLNTVVQGTLRLQRLHELMSAQPAMIFGLHKKAHIKEGYDADLTIVDLHEQQEVRGETFISKCQWTPFEGLVLQGWPVMTLVGGNVVYDVHNRYNKSNNKNKITQTKATPLFP